MRSFLLIFLIITCLSTSLMAQENFKKGQVVTLQGDTLNGYIDYKNWQKNPDKIKFKETENSQVAIYTPEDIETFSVIGNTQTEIYRAKKLQVSIDTRKIDELGTSSELTFEMKNLFLFLYVQGKINFYQYTDEWDNEHFFVEKDGNIEELKYKLYYALNDNREILQTQTYKRQLLKYTQDCAGITEKEILALNYNKGIIAIIKKYNTCQGGTSNYVFNDEKTSAKFELVAAMSTSYLNIKGAYPYNSTFKPSVDPALGFSMLLIMPRTNKKVGIYSELLYRQYKTENITEDYHGLIQASYTGNYIKLNTLFRYQFIFNQYKPYFHVGVSNALALSKIDKITRKSTLHKIDFWEGARKYEKGLAFGFGGEIKRFGFEVRGETTDGFTYLNMVSTNVKTIYTLMKYRF